MYIKKRHSDLTGNGGERPLQENNSVIVETPVRNKIAGQKWQETNNAQPETAEILSSSEKV